MKEYKVVWRRCPTNYNPAEVVFVEAENPKDAEVLASDYICRRYCINDFMIYDVVETQPLPNGRIIGR